MKSLLLPLLIVLLVLRPEMGLSQSSLQIDSLRQVVINAENDSLRLKAMIRLGWAYLYVQADSALFFAGEAMELAKKINSPKEELNSAAMKVKAFVVSGKYEEAVNLSQESLEKIEKAFGHTTTESEKTTLLEQKSDFLGILGSAYDYLGNYPEALHHYLESLKIREDFGQEGYAAGLYNNIGTVYQTEKKYSEALGYFQKALAINEKRGNKRWRAINLSNISNIYLLEEDVQKALETQLEARKGFEELGDSNMVAKSCTSLGILYKRLGNYPEALKNHYRALAINEETKDPSIFLAASLELVSLYRRMDNIDKASEVLKKGLAVAQETGNLDYLSGFYHSLSVLDSIKGDFRGAYSNYRKFKDLEDSTFNEKNIERLVQTQMQYEFEKKEALVRAEQEKKDALAQEELQRQKLVRNGLLGGFLTVLVFAGIFFRQRNNIKREKERSDELLLNILPEEVAEELKSKGSADAQLIDEVTVLFTDFKDFTQISETLSPKELVEEINACFSAFDLIMQKHGVEKIKTIGDAYMAAGGLPTPNLTHGTDVVKAALEIQQFMEERNRRKTEAGKPAFEIRIGIHSGSVVAGIVGIKKFAYDIWGDTVNTAARLESNGEAGQVNISETTRQLIGDQFTCIHRGKISAKGKGEIDMFFVQTG